MKKGRFAGWIVGLTVLLMPASGIAFSGEVPLGSGSYSTVKPASEDDVQGTIYKTQNVTGKMPTNDWWSSTAWVPYSDPQYPHPLAVKNQEDGLRVAAPGPDITANSACVCGWMEAATDDDVIIGHTGTDHFADTRVDDFNDWFVTNVSTDGNHSLKVTYGHGSPFVYAEYGGGTPKLKFPSAPVVWSGDAGSSVLGITVNGKHYGLFAPSGSTWNGIGTSTLTNDLNGQTYFSLALLPDNSVETLNHFKSFAYSFVTDTTVTWEYREGTSDVVTTYSFDTTAKEGNETGTIFALYPHQWKHTPTPLLDYTYDSVRGDMKTASGNSFQTSLTYPGVLPSLPEPGNYDAGRLAAYINEAEATSYDGETDTYWYGKRLGKLATLAPIAEQAGDMTAANHFRGEMKAGLEEWFQASDDSGNLDASQMFYYNDQWGTVIGYPDSFGSAVELNDHHFHYGYFIKAAAEIARVDSAWAQQSQWGEMVELLIRDVANTNRNSSMFPFLRNFDIYAGHSWASGHAKFFDGNNNESSSEAMNAWTGLILWGQATNNTELRDLGIYLYTTEMNAINEYWFDVNNENHHPDFTRETASMIWGGKTVGDAVWWTDNPEEVHGINWLPIQGGSLYLTQYPAYTQRNYDALVRENGGDNWDVWTDLIWMYRAIHNPSDAVQKMNAQLDALTPEAGNSKANTYHWIQNLSSYGTVDRTVTADTPLYAVFAKNGTRTYVAYNMEDSAQTVQFSDGHTATVDPHRFYVGDGSGGGSGDSQAPSAPGNLTSTGHTDSTVDLSWTASTDNIGVAGYEIYQGTQRVATTNTTTATITNLSPETTFTFTVKAKDAAGNVSASSNDVTVTTESSSDGGSGGDHLTEDYTAGVRNINDAEARIDFTPTTPSAYVDVHYNINGGLQMNIRMNEANGTWEHVVDGLQPGDTIDYWFTYEKNGPQYDSPPYSYTHNE